MSVCRGFPTSGLIRAGVYLAQAADLARVQALLAEGSGQSSITLPSALADPEPETTNSIAAHMQTIAGSIRIAMQRMTPTSSLSPWEPDPRSKLLTSVQVPCASDYRRWCILTTDG